MFRNFVDEWVYGGALCGVALLIVALGLSVSLGAALMATYLLLPVYMLHQLEEHAGDRFRQTVNEIIGGGTEVLTRLDVFIINVLGVWAVFAIAFTLAATSAVGFGLIAAYTMLINAIVHIAQAARLRTYNPGLATGVILFLPVGIWALLAISREGAGWGWHLLGIAVGLLLHVMIIVHVLSRLRRRAAT